MTKDVPRADADLIRDRPCRSVSGPVMFQCPWGTWSNNYGTRAQKGKQEDWDCPETKASSARGLQPGKGQVFIPGNLVQEGEAALRSL